VAIEINFSLKDNDVLQICISDNGNGMDKTTLNRIQQLFTTTKDHGTGLGLAVVRAVARAHGGEFQLHSKQGEGTTATLSLPLFSSGRFQPEKQAFEV